MTDLHTLLPDFAAAAPHAAVLLAGLETHRVSLSELLTLDAAEIGKRTRLPLIDLQRFSEEVRAALAAEAVRPAPATTTAVASRGSGSSNIPCITTLDPVLDEALGGGFPAGCLSEIVGESGAGKTQLLLTLLLAVQLPPQRGGLGRRALYISSEAPLATGRLTQMLRSTGTLRSVGGEGGANGSDDGGIGPAIRTHCSLQGIATINIPDLEAQEHILTHQLPVQLAKAERASGPGGRNAFGLVVIDSVAANFRPFFGGARDDAGAPRGGAPGLAARSLELARLGMLLRNLAQKHNLAVVVANQVADRFEDETNPGEGDGLSLLSQQRPPIVRSSSVLRRRPQPAHPPPPLAKRPRHVPPDGNSASTGTAGSASLQMPPPHHHRVSLTQESPLAARSRRQPEQPIPPLLAAALASSQTDSPLPTSTPPPPPPPPQPAEARPELPPSLPDDDTLLDLPTTQYIPPSLASQQFGPPPPLPVLKLDHQQRWFTGWGDTLRDNGDGPWATRNKTPALGLVWATQLAMRVALLKAPRVGGARQGAKGVSHNNDDNDDTDPAPVGGPRLRHSWRRWMKVVFAPHVAATAIPVEFEIAMGGLRALAERKTK